MLLPSISSSSSRMHNNRPSPFRIGNKERMEAFRQACTSNKDNFFDSRYRHRGHMFLKILLCHPDYQRRGAGRALTTWGIEHARSQRLNTTVFASPMGLNLYKKLGFQEIGRFRVQLPGETDSLEMPALVLTPPLRGGLDSAGSSESSGSEEEEDDSE